MNYIMSKKSTSQISTAVSKPDTSVDSFIAQAIQSNASVETLERLFALHKEVKAEQAKSQFIQALAEFQASVPTIEKTKKVYGKDKKLRYVYAPLDGIHETIKKPLAQAGLSYQWDVTQVDDHMKVTITLTHVGGHAVTSTLAIPIDKDGFMTAPQKYASAQTYAKRYTLINVLGITTSDEDTDATDVAKEKAPMSVKSKILFNLKTLNYDTTDRTVIEDTVKKLTGLDLIEENFDEINNRLEVLVVEKQEYDSSQVWFRGRMAGSSTG